MSLLEAEHRPLSRVLGVVFSLAVVVGGVIGSGILRTPGIVAKGLHSEPAILLFWAIGGVVAAVSAMPLVEAGASVPKAGGSYPIAARAFGPGVGLVTGWLTWLQYMGSNAFIAVAFAEFVHRLGLAGAIPKGALACALLVVCAGLNLSGTRVSGGSQSLASAIKGVALLAFIAVLFAAPRGSGAAHAVATPGLAGWASLGAVIMAVRVIYQTYAGWDAAIYFSEEVTRPENSVARATFGGIALVTVIYVLTNAAILHVLPPSAVAGSELAAADAARVALGPLADTVITALGVFSTAAIVNLQFMVAPRITWRMARDGLLPAPLGAVAANGAPWIGVLLMSAGCLALAATGSYEQLVRIYAPWSIGSIFMICLSAVRLRYTEPDLPRPYRMPFFPWVGIAGAALQGALIALVVADDPREGALSLLVALAPLPLYFAFKARRGRRAATS